MTTETEKFAGAVLIGAVCLAGGVPANAQGISPPNFTPDSSAGWFSYQREFTPPPSGPGPVVQDSRYPRVTNDDFRATGKQPTFPIADTSNPILQPWAAEVVKKRNATALSGTPVYSLHASCYPVGVLEFDLEPMTRPMFIVQGPKEVVMILTSFSDVRHIYLTDKHEANSRRSWYGDSIGHYEGDTLVVDTIGFNDTTAVDGFGTPHTDKLHVIERFRMIDNGQTLELNVHVEDPGTFTTPWNAVLRYRRYEQVSQRRDIKNIAALATTEEGPLLEAICPDNPNPFFPGQPAKPIPKATSPDF
jgi:hypothetical protein